MRGRGFTLIELLVVMLLIVIVLGVAGLSLYGAEARTLREETERLALLARAAAEDAVLQGRVLVLAFTPEGYQFMTVNDQGELAPITQDDVLRPRSLPPGVTVRAIEIEGVRETDARVVFFPSGEMPQFAVTLAHGEMALRIEGQANGEIRTVTPPS